MARRRLAGLGLSLAATGAVLAGCAGQPGVAATVDDRVITESDLARFVSDGESVLAQEPTADAALSMLILIPWFLDIAADAGAAVSEHDAVDLLEEVLAQTGAEAPEDGFGTGMIDLARWQLVQTELSSGEVLAPDFNAELSVLLDEAEIEVNPRYGEFDAESGSVLPREADAWIAVGREGTGIDDILGGFGGGTTLVDPLTGTVQ